MPTETSPHFTIKTPVFEGPLELLLSLIEKRKLLINDISLAQVTDDYIAHIRQQANFPIADSAFFILIASTLLLIKSKSLLPTLEITPEEQGNIEDLELRLKMYQRIKELSLHIKERFGKDILFAKTESKNIQPVFSPSPEITAANLVGAMRTILQNLPKHEPVPKAIVRKIVSLEEMIHRLTERVQSNLKMSFKDFSGMGKVEKVNVVVSFLAMLELVKQGMIDVRQDMHFSDIHMETQEVGLPRYNTN